LPYIFIFIKDVKIPQFPFFTGKKMLGG